MFKLKKDTWWVACLAFENVLVDGCCLQNTFSTYPGMFSQRTQCAQKGGMDGCWSSPQLVLLAIGKDRIMHAYTHWNICMHSQCTTRHIIYKSCKPHSAVNGHASTVPVSCYIQCVTSSNILLVHKLKEGDTCEHSCTCELLGIGGDAATDHTWATHWHIRYSGSWIVCVTVSFSTADFSDLWYHKHVYTLTTVKSRMHRTGKHVPRFCHVCHVIGNCIGQNPWLLHAWSSSWQLRFCS